LDESVQLILASKSQHRAALLAGAGLAFEARDSGVDERAVEQASAMAAPADRAELLACAKAAAVSTAMPDALVLGCDQILELDGAVLHKARTMDEARRRLLALSGRTHELHSALALAQGGTITWSVVVTAHMTMRPLDPGEIGRHLALAGNGVLGSVGCYQIEGPGLRLFERMEGDYWTIIGLPMMPLLARLRTMGLIDA
jgi:septum formation protein